MTTAQENRILEGYASFATVHVDDLKPLGHNPMCQWYQCPDCGNGAYNRYPGPLLLCPICDSPKWLDKGRGGAIKATLHDEEVKFRKLLAKFENLPDSMTVEEAFRLVDEQGCPEELLEDRTDFAALKAMREAKASTNRTRKQVYG